MVGKTNLFVVSKYFTQFHSSNNAEVCFLQLRSTNKNHKLSTTTPLPLPAQMTKPPWNVELFSVHVPWRTLSTLSQSSACFDGQINLWWSLLAYKEIFYGMWCVMYNTHLEIEYWNWIIIFLCLFWRFWLWCCIHKWWKVTCSHKMWRPEPNDFLQAVLEDQWVGTVDDQHQFNNYCLMLMLTEIVRQSGTHMSYVPFPFTSHVGLYLVVWNRPSVINLQSFDKSGASKTDLLKVVWSLMCTECNDVMIMSFGLS